MLLIFLGWHKFLADLGVKNLVHLKQVYCFLLLLAGTSDVVENTEQVRMPVKEAESLDTGKQAKERQREKEAVTKPVKKRPKSEGYELFEKEAYVIGLVSGPLAYPIIFLQAVHL